MKKTQVILALVIFVCGYSKLSAGTITLVGNGAGGGPIFVSSSLGSINIGTRLRVGTFNDLTLLTNTIAAFIRTNAPVSFTDTLAALNSNFIDLGTGASNYGSPNQTTGTSSTNQILFNTSTNLAINGVTNNYTVFNGSITNVTYSASIGASKNLYFWTAFNSELGIVRNADGSGTSAWITPTSDLSGVTMNMSGLQSSAGGTMQTAEVLLGTVFDYSSGSDLVALIPEPSTGTLLMLGSVGLVALRRLRKV